MRPERRSSSGAPGAGAHESTAVTCPRCDYDLRGLVDGWTDACPVEGTCTECGLDFRWGELLDPRWLPPDWSVESRSPARGMPSRCVITALRTLRPVLFWRRLRMIHPVRGRRLLAYAAALLLAMYLGLCGASGLLARRELSNAANQAMSVTPDEVILQAVAFPLSQRSIGTVRSSFGTWGLQPPYFRLYYRFHQMLPLLAAILFAPVASLLAFAALPQARRAAKVRWRHLVRVLVYGLTWTIGGLAVLVPLSVILLDDIGYVDYMLSRVAITMSTMAALFALHAVWWWAATTFYLRMSRPLAVAMSVSAIGALAPTALIAAIWMVS